MHRWTDSNGYQLNQRIWRIQGGQLAGVGPSTAAKIDAMINDGFAEGWSALRLSRQLEQFLLPSRANIRTNKPYGINASFDGMRLARTEIACAGNHASAVSAYFNPYVNTVDVARSPNGDSICPICPQHATIGIDGSSLRPAYSVHAMNYPVYHPHCKCHLRGNVTDNPEAVTMRLRAVMEDARVNTFPPAVTPAAIDNFTNMLLHRALGTIVGQWRGQLPLLGF